MFQRLAILALAALSAQAADLPVPVRLFSEPGVPVAEYGDRIAELEGRFKAGGGPIEIEFSGGRRFVLAGYLGGEGMNRIFETADGEAIRVARGGGSIFLRTLATYLSGYSVLRADGVEAIEVFEARSDPREFVLMAKEPMKMSYPRYLEVRNSLPSETRRAMDAEIVRFAVASWKYKGFGDQLPSQLGFTTGGRLKLYDWSEMHSKAPYVGSGTIFTPDFAELFAASGAVREGNMVDPNAKEKLALPADLHDSVLRAIREKRIAEGMEIGPIEKFFTCAKGSLFRMLRLGGAP